MSHHIVHGEYKYSEEPVTLQQKRVWKIKAILWMIPTGIIVIGSLVLVVVFSVIDSQLENGLPFLVMPAFAGVPLAFALPNLRQGFTRKPQVTQVRDYGDHVHRDVAKLNAKVECPQCKAENEFGATNCKDCGAEIPQRCPLCGADIITGDEACRYCGLAL